MQGEESQEGPAAGFSMLHALLHAQAPALENFGACTLKWWKWRSCVQRGAKSRWAWRPVAATAHEEGLLSFGQEKRLVPSRLVAV